ncbi:MAG: UPF0146 family protein [Nitrospirota bacterium]
MERDGRIEDFTAYIAERYRSVAEIGIGHYPDVAYALKNRGVRVFATDVRPFSYDGLRVVHDDITGPEIGLYEGVQLLYSLRTPSELVPYMETLARAISADLMIKPLSSEFLSGKIVRNGGITFYLWKFSLPSQIPCLTRNPVSDYSEGGNGTLQYIQHDRQKGRINEKNTDTDKKETLSEEKSYLSRR